MMLITLLLAACGGGGGSAGGMSVASVSHYQITGNVTGLSGGASLGLQVNGQSPLTVTAGGGFQFPGSFATGTAYQVSMSAQPAGETCSITNGSGTVGTANVTDIQVACTTNPAQTYTIGGTVTGLTSGTLVLQDNSGDNLSITNGGAFTFSGALFDQAAYDVTVLSQPSAQTCTVGNGSGTVQGSNVTGVTVGCTANSSQTFTIGGSITGLSGSVALQEAAGGSVQTFTANGTFAFSTKLSGRAPYDVTVTSQPTGQTCVVNGGSGTVGTSNVASVTVSCSTNPTYSIAGSVTGLNSGASVTLLDNGTDTLTISNNGDFTFPTQLTSGETYHVTVSAEPLHQVCTVTNGGGTITNPGVTNIAVACTTGFQFAYVANFLGNTVSAYGIDVSTGTLTPIGTFATGNGPYSVAVSSNGAFAYVVNLKGNTVSAYGIDASTGALTPIGTFATGGGPDSVAVSSNGAFAYVANQLDNTVSAYSIDASTGALTLIGTFATGNSPNLVAVSPNGEFAYAPNYTGNTVSAYGIDASTGALTPIGSFATGNGPSSVAVSPNGAFAYVPSVTGNTVSAYSVDASTGALTPIGTFATGNGPDSVAMDPAAPLAFVANSTSNTISAYSVGANGALSLLGTLPTEMDPVAVTVNPTGALVFVANEASNTVSVYTVGGGAAGSFATGGMPVSVAIAWP